MVKSKMRSDYVGFVRRMADSSLLRRISGAFFVNIAGIAIAFALQVLLARMLGVESFGHYVYALTWITLCVLFGKFGLDVAALRFIPEYEVGGSWSLLRGFILRSKQAVLIVTSVIVLLVVMAVMILDAHIDVELRTVFIFAALLLPLNAYLIVLGSHLQGFNHVAAAQAPQVIVRPLLLAVALVITAMVIPMHGAGDVAMQLNVVTTLMAIGVMTYLCRAKLPPQVGTAEPEYRTLQWGRVALPLMGITSFTLILNQADVIMIGALLSTTDAGIYSAASRVAMMLTFGITLVNSVAAPMISLLYTQGRTVELQRMLNFVAWGSFAFATPLCLGVIIFRQEIMQMFGAEFVAGVDVLLILAGARWINAITGTAGYLMSMSGHERQAMRILGVSALLNVLMNLLLIPLFGIAGAASATLVTTVLWSVVMVIYGRKYVGVNPSLSFRFS